MGFYREGDEVVIGAGVILLIIFIAWNFSG